MKKRVVKIMSGFVIIVACLCVSSLNAAEIKGVRLADHYQFEQTRLHPSVGLDAIQAPDTLAMEKPKSSKRLTGIKWIARKTDSNKIVNPISKRENHV